jgi:hypothetical protein
VYANKTIPITQNVQGHQTNSANIAASTDPSTALPSDISVSFQLPCLVRIRN